MRRDICPIHTLQPDDSVATSTTHCGLGDFQDGDKIKLETECSGRLTISVRDDLKRVVARDTTGSSEQKGRRVEVVVDYQMF